jgi:general L-amino acid transport system ATP-binding protein
MIKINNLNKWYGDFHVLKDINLEIKTGEKVVVCGPSGSGKSTLIRCINNLEQYQEGEVFVDSVEVQDMQTNIEKLRMDVGMVFQHFNLFPHLNILENLTIGPIKSKGLSEDEAKKRALNFLEKVKILSEANKYPDQLSGGQKQRVAIARTLCMAPKIILFDEPTSALDPEMVKEVLDVMMDLAKEGMAMICVTHEMGFAKNVADRIIFMDEGRIVEDASPNDFFENSTHSRVREFLSQIL